MSRFARPARLASFGLGASMALAACGGTNPSTGPAASLPAGTIAVEASKYKFTPSTISVPAGEVTFRVRNTANEEHEFEIFKGEAVVDEIEGLVPGLTLDLTVPLEAGEYTFVCKLNGHDQLGMTGTLTVTGG